MRSEVGENVKTYEEFIERKSQLASAYGFSPIWMPDFLFDFQAVIEEWAIRKGRAAIFADCGLGKTIMQLVWAENVVRYTNRPVLILAPLAVGAQTVREGAKFGLDIHHSRDGVIRPGINITNYERLHYFNQSDFAGVVCDESSILKSFDGTRRIEITEFMRKVKYRLLCTATAAPNDYMELGTSSEALGELGHMDMLNRFFVNDQNNSAIGRMRGDVIKWRLKGHADIPFWRWVCSWARTVRKPSDLGFDDGAFVLPELIETAHLVEVATRAPGMLFTLPAITMAEQRAERRRSVNERCEKVAELVSTTNNPALVWCHLNDEGDRLADLIEDSQQISGIDEDEAKEEAFDSFCSRTLRVLITKPKIGAWGLNFQHCNHVTCFPSHSFEQYYQGVRRCWRFGQERPVRVDIVTTEGERSVLENVQRKARAADEMFSSMVAYMNNSIAIDRQVNHSTQEQIPSWL